MSVEHFLRENYYTQNFLKNSDELTKSNTRSAKVREYLEQLEVTDNMFVTDATIVDIVNHCESRMVNPSNVLTEYMQIASEVSQESDLVDDDVLVEIKPTSPWDARDLALASLLQSVKFSTSSDTHMANALNYLTNSIFVMKNDPKIEYDEPLRSEYCLQSAMRNHLTELHEIRKLSNLIAEDS